MLRESLLIACVVAAVQIQTVASKRIVVVGSGPGASGFLWRVLGADSTTHVTWIESGGMDKIENWPAGYLQPNVAACCLHDVTTRPFSMFVAKRWRAFGGGNALNSGGPLVVSPNVARENGLEATVAKYWDGVVTHRIPYKTDEATEHWLRFWDSQGLSCVHGSYFDGRTGDCGVTDTTFNTDGTRRILAYDVWREHSNRIDLRLNTKVRSVVFNEHNQAIGVETAEGERIDGDDVVLAGGVFGTYEVLLRSGVGPQAQLDRHRIQSHVPHRPWHETIGTGIRDDDGFGVVYTSGKDIINTIHLGAAFNALYSDTVSVTHWYGVPIEATLFSLLNSRLNWKVPAATLLNNGLFKDVVLIKIDMLDDHTMSLELGADGTAVLDEGRRSLDADFVCRIHRMLRNATRNRRTSTPKITPLLTSLLDARVLWLDTDCDVATVHRMNRKRPLCAFHYHGGNRLVVDESFAVKGVSNLYISDASVLKTSVGGPSLLTIFQGIRVADAYLQTTT